MGKNRQKGGMKPESASVLLKQLINDYTVLKASMVMRVRSGDMTREAFLEDAMDHMGAHYDVDEAMAAETLRMLEQYVFGYAVLTPLLEDPDISDVNCVAWDNIRIKKKGIRQKSDIRFGSDEEYRQFVSMTATKNGVSLSNMTAIQRFTDANTSPDHIFRFTVSSAMVSGFGSMYLTVRKVPKRFPRLHELVSAGMMDMDTAAWLKYAYANGSMLICGGNSAGKTTILNALKESLPDGVRTMVVQQADELTTMRKDADMMFMHSIPSSGESRVSYELGDIAVAALTMDVDYFILGEIKGGEAQHVLKAAYSGQVCSATIHAPSARAALDKIVDYALMGAQSSGYTKGDLMKMLAESFRTVVFMKKYRVAEICTIKGYDKAAGEVAYDSVEIGTRPGAYERLRSRKGAAHV